MSDMLHQRVPRQEPTMTLLERWDKQRYSYLTEGIKLDEIRWAIAVAQKAQQHADGGSPYAQSIINEAEELLRGEK